MSYCVITLALICSAIYVDWYQTTWLFDHEKKSKLRRRKFYLYSTQACTVLVPPIVLSSNLPTYVAYLIFHLGLIWFTYDWIRNVSRNVDPLGLVATYNNERKFFIEEIDVLLRSNKRILFVPKVALCIYGVLMVNYIPTGRLPGIEAFGQVLYLALGAILVFGLLLLIASDSLRKWSRMQVEYVLPGLGVALGGFYITAMRNVSESIGGKYFLPMLLFIVGVFVGYVFVIYWKKKRT